MGQAVGEGSKVNRTAGDPDRKLLVKKLSRNEEIPGRGTRPEFHHITEANTGGFHSTPSMNLVNYEFGESLPSFLSLHGSDSHS